MKIELEQETVNNLIQIMLKALEVVEFCYKDGKWVGTETIRKSGEFVKIVSELNRTISIYEEGE